MALSEGQVLNERYRITTLLGESDFGAFYVAWDLTSNGPCVVEEIVDASEAAREHFTLAAGKIYQLNHPRLSKYIEAFSIAGQGLYLVRQYLEGQDLQTLFDQTDGPLSQQVVLPAVLQVCDALSYLHSQTPPMIHADIRPANILVAGRSTEDSRNISGEAFLIGLGVGTKFDSQTGTLVGTRAITPGFSSPESYGKGRIDARSDVYALGASLFYLLVGKRLPESVLIKSRDVLPPRPPNEFNPQISPKVSAAIMQAIQVDPSSRFQTVAEFKNALQETAPATTPAAPPTQVRKSSRRPALVIVVVILGIILLALLGGAGWLATSYLITGDTTDTPTLPIASLTSTFTSTVENIATSTVPAATNTAAVQPSATSLTSQIEDGRGVPMVLVPAGEFTMGSNFGAVEELPEHQVFLDSYYIDLYEVTNDRYAACVGDGACNQPVSPSSATNLTYYGNPEFSQFPVIMVTYSMAQEYCSWRNANLPTEAQWEKAARGADLRIFPWTGEVANCSLANFWNNESNCQHDTTAVGSYPQGVSPFGLFDMAGNVWEWVLDWFGPSYYASSPAQNPAGPADGAHRVVRGGAFSGGVGQIRVTTRGRNLPDNGYNYVGFRCASSAP